MWFRRGFGFACQNLRALSSNGQTRRRRAEATVRLDSGQLWQGCLARRPSSLDDAPDILRSSPPAAGPPTSDM